MNSITERAQSLIRLAGAKKLSECGGKNYDRWRNISSGKIRLGAEEIEVLAHLYPQYALWLVSGRTQPSKGHLSPDLDWEE
ncbi:DNA-binding protein [Pseudomonas aeruginosa]